MKRHPYRSALIVLAIGIVSFAAALAWPNSVAQNWSTSTNHFLFVLALITWLIIPALAVLSAAALTIYGLTTKHARMPTVNTAAR